jgi:phosphinothricin acetyltransferase
MPKLRLRDATSSDVDAILSIHTHYILTSTCIFRDLPDSRLDATAWVTNRSPLHPVVVAEEDGVVVGFGSITAFRPRNGYRHTVEDSVYVSLGNHGRGIGSAVLGELVRRAQELGHHAMIGVIEAQQPVSIALHAKHGFVEAGRLPEVGTKFGRWLDAVLMHRLL